jgi:hypothetical protein
MLSGVSPKLARRERALEATRRRLKRLEIETHRIKAELARLEADYEDDLADELAQSLRRHNPRPTDEEPKPNRRTSPLGTTLVGGLSEADSASKSRAKLALETPPIGLDQGDNSATPRRLPVIGVAPSAPVRSRRPLIRKPPDKFDPTREPTRSSAAPRIVASAPASASSPHVGKASRRSSYRKAGPSLVVSFGIHAVAILLCLSMSFAVLVNQNIPLLASPTLLDEMPNRLNEIEITAHKFADDELQNVVSESDDFNISDNLLAELDPAEMGAGTQSLSDIGQLDTLPSDLGTLMAGAGARQR